MTTKDRKGHMKQGKPAGAFASRIVGEGVEAPDQLLANPQNWRRHPKEQRDALRAMLRGVGWVQRVIVNRTTGHIVDGHLRVEVAMADNEPAVPVIYVELSETEERAVLAAIDPIGGMAETDQAQLDELLDGLKTGDDGLDAFLAGLVGGAGGDANPYTMEIKAPTYKVTGEAPAAFDLVDESKTLELRAAIDAADGIDDETRRFLRLAADRHTVFDFRRIAEFYAHAPAEVQELMESSALVIIDYRAAIAGGFVALVGDLQALAGADSMVGADG